MTDELDTTPNQPLDPDSTGPLPTIELAEAHSQVSDSGPLPPVDTVVLEGELPPEPQNAPGRETIPVQLRQDSDSFAGSNHYLAWGSRSDVGLVRSHNEDSMLVEAPLFCVCDGMGGHAAGEVASSIAVQSISKHAPVEADDVMLGAAVEHANREVIQAAEEGRGLPGMGCTASCVLIDGSRMAVAHVGDSRVYVLHAGTLVRVTHDHSFVEELVDAGEITVGEARVHPSRSIITRALGSDPDMYADHFMLDVEAGDRIIVCSDGLSSMVTDAQIEAVAVSNVTPQGAADNLVAEALAEGGHDNVTVVVIDVLDDGSLREHQRFLARGVVRWIIGILLVAVLAAVTVMVFINNSYYIANNDGTVGIYQGVRGEFMGMELSHLSETSSVNVSDLPEAVQAQVEEGIHVGSLEEARNTVESYRDQIDAEKEKAAQVAEDTGVDDISEVVPESEAAPSDEDGKDDEAEGKTDDEAKDDEGKKGGE